MHNDALGARVCVCVRVPSRACSNERQFCGNPPCFYMVFYKSWLAFVIFQAAATTLQADRNNEIVQRVYINLHNRAGEMPKLSNNLKCFIST